MRNTNRKELTEPMRQALRIAREGGGAVCAGKTVIHGAVHYVAYSTIRALENRGLVTIGLGAHGGPVGSLTGKPCEECGGGGIKSDFDGFEYTCRGCLGHGQVR